MNNIILLCALFGCSVLQYIAVEVCAQGKNVIYVKPKYKLTGVITYMFVNAFLIAVTGSMRVALNVGAALFGMLAVANHYVYDMHGTPFTMDIIHNAGTALNVLSAYKIKIEKPVWAAVVLTALEIALANTQLAKVSVTRPGAVAMFAVLTVLMWIIYLAPKAVVHKNIVTWPWSKIIAEAGYISGFVQNTLRLFNIVQPIGQYSEEQLKQYIANSGKDTDGGNTPDIILILNETLYDLNMITDTGEKTFEYLNSLEDCAKGYAVSPAVGGGTNKSEYEFLTSNSLYVAPNITPFYSLDINSASSVATMLKHRGYTTLATHPAPGSNYSRTKGYSGLGFDNSKFIEDYKDIQHFGSRMFATDETVYKNLINWYENMGEEPRFIYALTIQNHGGYVFNKESENTVKVKKDFEDNTSKVNEFLSCMQLSDKAFKVLVDYFKNCEREVLICMMGDHAPDFAKNVIDGKYSEREKETLLRSVPYIIWSNKKDMAKEDIPQQMGMVGVVPQLLKAAGVQLSGYYQYICTLAKCVPVITAYGEYRDRSGKVHTVCKNEEYYDDVKRYFDLAYANVKGKDFMADFAN